MNSNYTIAATLHSRDMIFTWNISVNTLHKGDDDDDDDKLGLVCRMLPCYTGNFSA
jgi:hypothetical protein